jgi:hypothetical protein
MYLVDTNIWLERLLEQDRSEEVERFLDQVPSDQLLMTDFSFRYPEFQVSPARENPGKTRGLEHAHLIN